MKLDGIHHVTCITGDAPANSTSTRGCSACGWSRRPSTRTTRPSTTSSTPTSRAARARDITFFEYPGARRGRAGAGMVHTVGWRVALGGGARLLGTAARRRGRERVARRRTPAVRRPGGPRPRAGRSSTTADEPLVAEHPEIPAELALQGFDGVRAFAADARGEPRLLEETLGFEPMDDASRWEVRGERRGGLYAYDPAPAERGVGGAGTVHHVAWSSTMDDHEAWRKRVADGGRAADAGDRPLLVPVDLLPRAERRAVRDRDARTGLRRRRGPGAPRRVAGPAARRSSICATQVEPVLTPLPDPRARGRAT